ncbi:hypothetical protein LTR94_036369, partial [Friedmanniomyces endolithicus]
MRSIPIADFHRLPGNTPHIETVLEPGELITSVKLPKPLGGVHAYRKVRDRASYAFALVSVATVILPDGSRQILRVYFPGDFIGSASTIYSKAPESLVA